MKCEEVRVDLRTVPHSAQRQRSAQLLFQLNHTLPFSEEYNALLRELLGDHLGEGSTIAPPLSGAALDMLKIGKGVFVNSNLLAMARGGITIGDHARIAANVQLISNNHDPYDLDVLTCKPVEIGDYAWIGAGATILPGCVSGVMPLWERRPLSQRMCRTTLWRWAIPPRLSECWTEKNSGRMKYEKRDAVGPVPDRSAWPSPAGSARK